MKRIFVPTSSGTDWQRLLAKPELHWKAGRSAMSAAACWEDSFPKLPEEITRTLEASGVASFHGLELALAVPEWETDLPGGDRPSQTDIMALARNEAGLVALGVEAKVDEPFGPTLGEKLKNASSGQTERIKYLQEQLGCTTPMPDSLRYQLLHRTVSAALIAEEFHAHSAVMLVQSFSQEGKWREDFSSFSEHVAVEQLAPDFFKLASPLSVNLFIGWCQGHEKYLSTVLPSAL